MDPLSITFGLAGIAGLFSVCIDVLDRVEVYKSSDASSAQLLLRVKAEKLKLQEWADAVGIDGKTLKNQHHYRLDDQRVRTLVDNILLMIADLFGANDRLLNKLQLPGLERNARLLNKLQLSGSEKNDVRSLLHQNTHTTPFDPTSKLSVKTKLKWSFKYETGFTKNVETLEILTEKLYSLVSPYTDQNGPPAYIRDSSDDDDDHQVLLTLLNVGKDLRSLVENNQIRARTESLRLIDDLLNIPKLPDDLDTHSRSRLDGTCDWVFQIQAYKDWIDPGSTTARCLWLYGPPGFGKTVLCSNIVKTLEQSHSPFVFHFFSSRHAPDGALDDIIRIWISQIARIDSSCFELVSECMKEHILCWDLTSSDLWTAFGNIVSEMKQCVFLIDGLDEYRDTGAARRDFLSSLKQSLAHTTSALLITSRDDPEIRAQLTSNYDSGNRPKLFWHNITATDNREDISLVSRQIIEKKLANKNESLRSYLASHLTERCDGMFLWLTMATGEFRKGLSEASLRRKVESVPKGLNSTFARNWQRILDQSEDEKEQGLKILRWCVFSIRPLTVAELTEALIIDPSDELDEIDPSELPDNIDDDYIESEIKNLCGSLVDAISPDLTTLPAMKTVQLIHLSVKEYILSMANQLPSDSSNMSTYFSLSCHLELAKICLDYLCRCNSNTSKETATATNNAFREYAIRNWTVHRDLAKVEDPTFHHLLARFLDSSNTNFQAWVKEMESQDPISLYFPIEDHHLPEASPLYWASFLGSLPVMELLRNRNDYPVNSFEGVYGPALQMACAKGHCDAAITLMNWTVDTDSQIGLLSNALGASAYSGHETLVLELLKRNAEVNLQGKWSKTPLFIAAFMGHLDVVRILLDNRADIEIPQEDGQTPLHIASVRGYSGIVQLLLEKGADIDRGNAKGYTPLLSASMQGHLQIVQLLLSKGADINKADNDGWTPILGASNNGRLEIVRLLLAEGADIGQADINGWTALMCASNRGDCEISQLLLQNGADIDQAYQESGPSLHIAASLGYRELVQLLLASGADVNRINGTYTPLLNAANAGHLEIVRLLLTKGANINQAEGDGWTSLNCASYGGFTEVVQLLLAHGADINQTNHEGCTPLHSASTKGHTEIVRLLLDKGADINRATSDGWTPVSMAVDHEHMEILQLLLAEGADINQANDGGWTPLNWQARKGCFATVKSLLEKGADPKIANNYGYTPIFSAAIRGHYDLVRWFLDSGIDVDKASNLNNPPLFQVIRNGQSEVVKLLGQEFLGQEDSQGRTSIHHAAGSGNLAILDYVLAEQHVAMTLEDKFGRNALDYAAMSGSLEMVEKVLTLLRNENSPSLQSSSIWSPLHWACRNGSFDILNLLTEANTKSLVVETELLDSSWTPLDLAVYWQNTKVISCDNAGYTSRLWLLAPMSDTKVDNGAPFSLNTFRSNALSSPGKKFTGFCDGCFGDIMGPRFQCKECYEFDYCFMCKHEGNEAHPGHEWQRIEPDDEKEG